jgi:hypothetical protein
MKTLTTTRILMKKAQLLAVTWLAALIVAVGGAQAQSQNSSVRGSGTTGQIAKWIDTGQIGNSVITEVDGRIGIGTTTPGSSLTVAGRIEAVTTGPIPALLGQSGTGSGVRGNSDSGFGVFGSSGTGDGVRGLSASGNGLFGFSQNGNGVSGGTGNGSAAGVIGANSGGGGLGVLGQAFNGTGVRGISSTGFGVFGSSVTFTAVEARSNTGFGIFGSSNTNTGIHGQSGSGTGVFGTTGANGSVGVHGTNTGGGVGVLGEASTAAGVLGVSDHSLGAGVAGHSTNDGIGATGQSPNGLGVFGATNTGVGVWAQSAEGGTAILAVSEELAGRFIGDVTVTGVLSKGGGSFRIDHPLDPANKYLSHSFVESPDMLNIYTGNVTTDDNGDAAVVLPEYFMALNRSFRYQLTVIGQFAQAIVAEEITDRRFTIKTDKPRVKVSWQVTGIRQDAWANRHRIRVEEEKPDAERGYYLHPELYDQPDERHVEWARRPELMKRARDAKQQNR